MTIKLRPKQNELADAIRQAFGPGGYRSVLAVAHTAFGKTVLFSYIVFEAMKKGRRVLIMAHRQELIDQISRTLRSFGVEHGIISPQYTPNYLRQVQVASVATMNARFKKIPERFRNFDLIILDEAHHLLATNTFGKVYDLLGRPRILGVTATPERGDGKGLGESVGGIFQTMVEVTTVRESIDEGYLSDFVVYAPAAPIDLSDIKTKMGDFDKHALAERVDRPTVTGDAVREYAKRCPTYPAVVFCVSIEHCKHVAAEFQAAGFDFRVIDGTMDDAQRKSLIRGLGKTHLGLVSADLISEGTDVPSIACAIFLRPTKSLGLFIQQAGRAIRPVYADGYDLSTREGRLDALANGPKPRAVLLDHAGLSHTHGLIDEDREWSLEGTKKAGKRKKKDDEPTVPVTQCKKCYACFSPSAAVAAGKELAKSNTSYHGAPCCPHCKAPVEVKARKVEHVDGELHEITREMAAQISREKRRRVGRARSLEDLQKIGAEMGYSPKWARIIWETRNRKRAPQRPPEPSLDELKQMTLPELENVANAQSWPRDWASNVYHSNRGSAA